MKFFKIILLVTIFVLLFNHQVSAQNICGGVQQPNQLCDPTMAGDIPTFIETNLFGAVAAIIGLFTIVMVVYSGFRMVISQGQAEDVAKAKTALQWTLTGFGLTLFAYIIIVAIGKFFNTQPIDPGQPTPPVNPISNSDATGLIGTVLQGALEVIGTLAILFILISSFRYIFARGDEEMVTQAKQGLRWAIFGLIVTILAYVLVVAVNKFLTG